jgi:hypothetical protein
MSKLKEQTLFSASSINNKDLFWISKYISGTEGSAGVYETFRITGSQMKSMLSPVQKYITNFTPVTVGSDNTVTHNLGSQSIIYKLYDIGDNYNEIIASVSIPNSNTIKIVFNENPIGNVLVCILAL